MMKQLLRTSVMASLTFVALSLPAQAADLFCSQYTRTLVLDGAPTLATGNACQQNDGSWQTVTSQDLDILQRFNTIRYVKADELALQNSITIVPAESKYFVTSVHDRRNDPYRRKH